MVKLTSRITQMTFLLNGRPVDALALIVHRSAEQAIARAWVKKLREWLHSTLSTAFHNSPRLTPPCTSTDKVIPRQLFEVPIQALVGKKVLARETLSAFRSDVTAGLYGGE